MSRNLLSLTGKGKSGEWSPQSLTPVEPTLSELPTLYLSPIFKLPFSWTVSARLPSVLISLTIPIFIAFIAFELSESKKTAYFTCLLALFNPWIWQNSRMTFDVIFSLWFYLIGILVFLKTKKYWKLLSFIPFFLGFYSYQGFKLILPLINLVLIVYDILREKQINFLKFNWWHKQLPNLLLILTTVSLLIYYVFFQFLTQQDSQNKLNNQLLTPNSDTVIEAVHSDRRLALETSFNQFFINKYTQTIKEVIGRLLLVFGWRELFFEISASNSSFAVWSHGMLYLVDALLIGIGLYHLIKEKKYPTLFFIGSFLSIGAIPSAINQNIWLFFRSSFIIPSLIILASFGINKLWQKTKTGFTITLAIYIV